MRLIEQIIVVLFLALGAQNAIAQLSVAPAGALAMVDYLVDEENGTVEFDPASVSFTGNANMLGRFNGMSSNIGLDTGIIMSTGRVQNAIGPNDDEGWNGNGEFNRTNSSNLLNSILITESSEIPPTFDAAILKFNFRVLGDYVKFRYVFASEEYPEFVNSGYNDVFAFFISGPGISGNENLAVVPGSNLPVTIDNINSDINSAYFVFNGSGNGSGGATVQYDGFTRPLTAQKNGILSCQWYTLTLIIADVQDDQFDSAVLLEAGSLSSNAPSFTPGTLTTVDGIPVFTEGVTDMNENCGSMVLKIRVGNEPLPAALTFPLTIGGTATPGVDYQALPSSVTIPAGSFEVSIPIILLSDATNEGAETIDVTYNKLTCSGPVPFTQTFTILDPPLPISITTSGPFNYTCPRIETTLNATISGGRPPYQFQWAGFDEQENPVDAIPEQTTDYTFNLVDACGTTASATTQVNIPGYLPLTISAPSSYIICKGDQVLIGAAATGGKAPVTYSWSPITDFSPVVQVQPQETTVYTLTATDDCQIEVSKDITIKVNEVVALFDVTYIDQRVVQFSDLSYDAVQTWSWDFDFSGAFSSEQNPIVTFPDTGWYRVELEVTDANNCRDIVSNPIYAYPPYSLFIPNAFTPDGDGINDVFLALGQGYADFEMWIFNRWGEQIYYTDSDSEGWGSRGRYSLEDLASGVYAYRIVTRRPTLEKNEYLGKVVVFE